jgi:2-phosphosulfolactate phosphatase
MLSSLDVLFTPADFVALKTRDLQDTACVVFDVFRATTSMVTALANGAREIVPMLEIAEALAFRDRHPGVLLAGERNGRRIGALLTGGVEFDLGNSPREFTETAVAGKTIVMTTTNGTRALRSCAHARTVVIGAFLNLVAAANFIRDENPARLLLVCSGTHEEAAYEDVLAAGACCELLWSDETDRVATDAARISRRVFKLAELDLAAAAQCSRNGRRLLGMPDLRDDVPFSLQRDVMTVVGKLQPDGSIKRVS